MEIALGYALAVAKVWWALLPGVAGEVLWITSKATRRPELMPSHRFSLGLLLAGVLIAQLVVWNDLRLERDALAGTLASFEGMQLDVTHVSVDMNRETGSAELVVAVSITNQGKKSVATDWKCDVLFPNGERVAGKIKPLWEQEAYYLHPYNKPRIRLDVSSGWILEKLQREPLPQGAREDGFIVFSFPSVSRESMNQGRAVRVSFADAYGNEHSKEIDISGPHSWDYRDDIPACRDPDG